MEYLIMITKPSCHKNAAKTARKLSAKPAGRACFGNNFGSLSFSSLPFPSCLSMVRYFLHVDEVSVDLRVLSGDAQTCGSIETVIVLFICFRGDCGSMI